MASVNVIGLVDNTYLKPYGSTKDIDVLIEDTARYGAYAIAINPVFLRYAREYMARKGYTFRVVAVVDFPFGAGTTELGWTPLNVTRSMLMSLISWLQWALLSLGFGMRLSMT
ncbi:hypothetical protein [Vulcanisaeta sp. JCM 16159]|uniref:hypothetical protein n=1 Tax=Vulcanisaeta sp. JCM 16159 TaxID=1295371 RepID=UPI001FB4AF72|nr:hypothetical protein [Vulcanisaeta sp. JCM 16159]